MPKIILGLDEGAQGFVLTGDTPVIVANKRLKLVLHDAVRAEYENSDSIRIPYNIEERENTLLAIERILKKFNLEVVPSEIVSTVFARYYEDQRDFEVFSKSAYDIRNDNLDAFQKSQLGHFSDVLKKKLKRSLYPLQLLSAYHLAFSRNACNFSVPGSGKTSIVYAVYAYLKALPPDDPRFVDKLLIVGPLSCFGPWEDEYSDCFGAPTLSKRLAGGITAEVRTNHLYSANPAELTLASYNSVAGMTRALEYFLQKHKVMVVLDEAHRIKNVSDGVMAQAALSIAKYCKSRVVLTGTPAPNGYEDVYNLFKFIWPTKNLTGFHLNQLAEMSLNPRDPRIPQLVANLSPYFTRIKKSHLRIPAPIEHPAVVVPMGNKQAEIYRYIERAAIQSFQQATSGKLRDKFAKARLIRLMQASTNPALLAKPLEKFYQSAGLSNELLIDDEGISKCIRDYRQNEIPPKFAAVAQILKPILESGGSAVIWGTFVQNLLDLQEYLGGIGVAAKCLYGETPVDSDDDDPDVPTREAIIREFHSPGSSFKVLIANPFAVGESISLHRVCHHAIYLERSFNAGHYIQSKDRIHRYGLSPADETHYYFTLSDNLIDRTIHSRLIDKERRMMGIIESEEIPFFEKYLNAEADDDIRILVDAYLNQKL